MDNQLIKDAIHDAVIRAVTEISADVKTLVQDALAHETNETAKSMLSSMLENLDIAKAQDKAVCQSPGYPTTWIMVSYVRARAEGLGIECKIGFLQRPERVVITSIATLATGITGQCRAEFDPAMILMVAMGFIAVFANITAFARVNYSKRILKASNK